VSRVPNPHAADRPDGAQASVRAAPSASALWNGGLCGCGLEGLQLMRRSLGSALRYIGSFGP